MDVQKKMDINTKKVFKHKERLNSHRKNKDMPQITLRSFHLARLGSSLGWC